MPKPEWSTIAGVAQMTQPAVAEVVTPVPKVELEDAIARIVTDLTEKNDRIAELQAEVTILNADKAAMDVVLAGVTGDPV